ncbi:PfkB [Pseudooceanicola batsensis HTCC2597]|uniref:PfkB n=1 Tax=Pseudooceanicola batsensis (strain ATCC BAA-863 / DSM 15984 / KCTC 12145 / HTCC2597) TaxID=252305 RepID=A3TYM5_PSEBH|nr:sugar kinase [Pseudooceanicola batsensis]EAQ03259.1 PfkB [Pseudooceanicola batsensis HTCC2597]
MDILCFGEPMLEFNEQPDGRFLAGHGGDTSNCAVAARRSGARVGVLTHLGADAAGDSFMRLWKDEGIETGAVRRNAEAHTGVYFITHGPDGHSFSYLRKDSAASRIRPADIDPQVIAQAGVLHVSGITQAISDSSCDAVFAAMEAAREAGVQVSFDTNLRLKLWPLARARAVIHAAMEMADIALPGLEDAEVLTGLSDPDAIADFYLGLGAGVVALTLGAEGTLVATGERRDRVAAFPVEAVDATAAGDTFDGAFLAELRAGRDPFAAARYANAAAALSTRGYGAVAPMPKREAVEAFLNERTAP